MVRSDTVKLAVLVGSEVLPDELGPCTCVSTLPDGLLPASVPVLLMSELLLPAAVPVLLDLTPNCTPV